MLRSKKRKPSGKIDSLIGQQTELTGDVKFTGGLLVDGTIRGNVFADEESNSFLNLSEHGTIEGEVNVPNIQLNGAVIGDVRAGGQIELMPSARVSGNVYYRLIEMAMGAEVNGNLVHMQESESRLKLNHEPPVDARLAPPTDMSGNSVGD